MVAYISKFASKTPLGFGPFTLQKVLTYTPNLMIWGGASTAIIAVFTEGWPKFQDSFYKKIPVFGSHWIHETDPEDLAQ